MILGYVILLFLLGDILLGIWMGSVYWGDLYLSLVSRSFLLDEDILGRG